MENLFLFLATSLVLRTAAPRLRRYGICAGCSAYLHSGNRRLQVRRTREGDTLYFNEFAEGDVLYGLVCIQMQDRYTLQQAETILQQYMKRARKPLAIRAATGTEFSVAPQQLSLTDYWQDSEGQDWKVKGYTNGEIVALLYVKNITSTTVEAHDRYLNGFRFSFT